VEPLRRHTDGLTGANPVSGWHDTCGVVIATAHSVASHDVSKSHTMLRLAPWWIDVYPPSEALSSPTALTTPQVDAILWRHMSNAYKKSLVFAQSLPSPTWRCFTDALQQPPTPMMWVWHNRMRVAQLKADGGRRLAKTFVVDCAVSCWSKVSAGHSWRFQVRQHGANPVGREIKVTLMRSTLHTLASDSRTGMT
jgi:hypothetical protein